jgi:SAM-dependent methyltransferase
MPSTDDDRGGDGTDEHTPEQAVARTRRAYERIADDYRERNAAVDPVEELLERFRDALPETSDEAAGPRVLDAGCGHGRDAAWLAARGCRVVGLDIAAAQLANARERAPDAALVRGDLRSLPLVDRRFDGVLAVSVKRSLGEDGEVKSGFTHDDRYFVAHDPDGLRGRLEDAGLTVREVDPDGEWVWTLARRPG